jgi:hypothetical protein
MAWFSKKSKATVQDVEAFYDIFIRWFRVNLFAKLASEYAIQMNSTNANLLAAQVVNVLTGNVPSRPEELDEQLRPLLMEVPERAFAAMRSDALLRKVVVYTLRVKTILECARHGAEHLVSAEHIQTERVLLEFGPEVPEEVTLERYAAVAARYRAEHGVYKLQDGISHVIVDSDGVVFQLGEGSSKAVRFARHDLVSVMHRASKSGYAPDVVVMIYRDADGRLDHFTWSLKTKGVCQDVSEAIYRIIDRGFRKAFVGFFYSLTHRIEYEK